MSHEYEKVASPASGLRLHLNENTSGCSPAVLAALHSITCMQAAFYPDHSAAAAACARHLGVDDDRLLLTNGLDEGILAAAVAALRASSDERPYEGIVVVPAFDEYAACIDAVGGRVVEVPHGPEFSFPLDDVLQALNERTRIVFLTNPNNPTGLIVPRDAIVRIADAAPRAMVFLDEAYADFSGTSLIGDAAVQARPNVVIGRTFAKAYGLAALRVGAVIASPETLRPIKRVVPPYSINIAATVALPVALADRGHFEWYLRETAESKQLLYAALDRLGVPYWRSATNFVLARFGEDARRVVAGLGERDVHVRDKSRDPACAGCVRITTGLTAHTRACIAAIEEVLCAKP
jgi:histidinol-phosphate aminotransferase